MTRRVYFAPVSPKVKRIGHRFGCLEMPAGSGLGEHEKIAAMDAPSAARRTVKTGMNSGCERRSASRQGAI